MPSQKDLSQDNHWKHYVRINGHEIIIQVALGIRKTDLDFEIDLHIDHIPDFFSYKLFVIVATGHFMLVLPCNHTVAPLI